MLQTLTIVPTQYLYQITAAGDRDAINAMYDWLSTNGIRTWSAFETLDMAGTPKPVTLKRFDTSFRANGSSIFHRSFQVREADMLLIKLKWTPNS